MNADAGHVDLKPLTSLRFVAVLLVFLYHAPLRQSFARDHALGQAGVGFFFLLSGFILTYTYAPQAIRGRFNAPAFYVARIARIYPAYLVSIAIALAVLATCGGVYWNAASPFTRSLAVTAQVLAIQAWFPSEAIYFGVNSPAWSLSVEAFFYALFPVLIGSLTRSFATSSARTIIVAALATWGCVAAVFAIPHRADVWSTYVFPPVRLVDFIVGMLLGLAFLRGYRLRGSATAWEAAAVLAIYGGIVLLPGAPNALQYGLALMPLWGTLIAIVALRAGALSRVLSHPIFVRLGEISYAFYLVHLSMLLLAERILPPAVAGSAAFIASIGLASTLNVLVERPMRAWIRSFTPRPAIAPGTA
jgi:peptidoglycan/LPS O-acetylase OafA/YrhL